MMPYPCTGCAQKFERCTRICAIFRGYQDRQREARERARVERNKEVAYNTYKTERINETKKKARIE